MSDQNETANETVTQAAETPIDRPRMQYKDVKKGTYPAKAVKWGISIAKTGNKGLLINYEVLVPVPGSPVAAAVHFDKVHYFSEGALPITNKAMVAHGAWPRDADMKTRATVMGELIDGKGALPNEVEVVLDLEPRERTDPETGETTRTMVMGIQFVNEVGSGGGLKITETTEAERAKIKSDLFDMFAKLGAKSAGASTTPARPSLGGNRPTGPVAPKAAAASDDDLPF